MTARRRKSLDGEIVKTAKPGILGFYAATFRDSPDAQGDIIDRGAFDPWLARLRASGKRLPIVWSHNWSVASDVIGWADASDISVDATGLLVRATLDLSNPTAARVFDLAQRKVLTDASLAFSAADERRDARGVNHIRLFKDIFEAGPCLVGADRDAGIMSASKTDALEQYRRQLDLIELETGLESALVKTAPRNSHSGQFATREALAAHLDSDHGWYGPHLVGDLEELHHAAHSDRGHRDAELARVLGAEARRQYELDSATARAQERAKARLRRERIQAVAKLELDALAL